MVPEKFSIPWTQYDPNDTHGGIPRGNPADWVAPDLGDNVDTVNADMHSIVLKLCQFGTSISMHPESDMQGLPPKDIVESCLMAASTIIEDVVDVTHTNASKFFSFTTATPPRQVFALTPIRFPVRSEFAKDFLHYVIGSVVQAAESNRNAVHKGLDPKGANIILGPLYAWKANVMKKHFGIEVPGEISSRELSAMYDSLPFTHPGYPDEDESVADAQSVRDALTGRDVLAWLPTEAEWSKFAQIQERRFEPSNIYQPEGRRPTSEDNVPENPVPTGTSTAGQP